MLAWSAKVCLSFVVSLMVCLLDYYCLWQGDGKDAIIEFDVVEL